MKVVHLISGLGAGGAERMLEKVVRAMDDRGHQSLVVSMTDEGPIGASLRKAGSQVVTLRMGSGNNAVGALRTLIGILRKQKPDLIQSWMYHADLFGVVPAKLLRIPLIWNIRQSEPTGGVHKSTAIAVARVCAALSGTMPDAIVCCSGVALKQHISMGYSERNAVVISNGFDLRHFERSEDSRKRIRSEIGVGPEKLVGMVARFDPQKDHLTFIRAAGTIARSKSSVRFLLCGLGTDSENSLLGEWIDREGLRERIHLLGYRSDLPAIFSALDIMCLSSSCGEGFPNVLGEAMACGVPCVATDVGDSKLVVGATGVVVPPGDYESLAEGMERILYEDDDANAARRDSARRRIADLFSIEQIVLDYEQLYRRVLERRPRAYD